MKRVKDRFASCDEQHHYFDFTGVEKDVAKNTNYSWQNKSTRLREISQSVTRVLRKIMCLKAKFEHDRI